MDVVQVFLADTLRRALRAARCGHHCPSGFPFKESPWAAGLMVTFFRYQHGANEGQTAAFKQKPQAVAGHAYVVSMAHEYHVLKERYTSKKFYSFTPEVCFGSAVCSDRNTVAQLRGPSSTTCLQKQRPEKLSRERAQVWTPSFRFCSHCIRNMGGTSPPFSICLWALHPSIHLMPCWSWRYSHPPNGEAFGHFMHNLNCCWG